MGIKKVSSAAERQARMLGVSGDVIKRVSRMADQGAPITHEKGNLRFDDFVLQVDGDLVQSIAPID